MIKNKELTFSSNFSNESKELLIGLLEKNPEKRFTYRDVISSKFFNIDL